MRPPSTRSNANDYHRTAPACKSVAPPSTSCNVAAPHFLCVACRVADPARHFADGIRSLFNPIGSVVDKINVGVFRLKSLRGSLVDVCNAPEVTTEAKLQVQHTLTPCNATWHGLACICTARVAKYRCGIHWQARRAAVQAEGFSAAMIDRFFRPFLGGIFFDRSLTVTSRLFTFVMRMLATGSNCLPARGIGAVADQVAADLPAGVVHLGTRVASISDSADEAAVVTESGVKVAAPLGVVVAVDGPESKRLLEGKWRKVRTRASAARSCKATTRLPFTWCEYVCAEHPVGGAHSSYRAGRRHVLHVLRHTRRGSAASGEHPVPRRRRRPRGEQRVLPKHSCAGLCARRPGAGVCEYHWNLRRPVRWRAGAGAASAVVAAPAPVSAHEAATAGPTCRDDSHFQFGDR